MKVISATRLNECNKRNWGIKVQHIMTNINAYKAGDNVVILHLTDPVGLRGGAQMAESGKPYKRFYFNIFGDMVFGHRMT